MMSQSRGRGDDRAAQAALASMGLPDLPRQRTRAHDRSDSVSDERAQKLPEHIRNDAGKPTQLRAEGAAQPPGGPAQRPQDALKRAAGLTDIHVTFRNSNVDEAALVGEGDDASEAEQNFEVLKQFWTTRSTFGLARIRMGAYLHLIRQHQLWRGVADSWDAFLAKENVQPNAARQYINVAKKFVFELDLPEETLAKLSLAGMTALEKAALAMSDANQAEVIQMLSALTERDAIQQLLELSTADLPKDKRPAAPILRLLKDFYELPPDMQSEFKGKIISNDQRRATRRLEDDRAIHTKYPAR